MNKNGLLFLRGGMLVVGVLAFSLVSKAQTAGKKSSTEKKREAPYTSFCQKRFLKKDHGKLLCNWGDSFAYACNVTFPADGAIEKDAVISGPTVVGKCSDNKQPVVKIVHN
jgi:hypothetical protein